MKKHLLFLILTISLFACSEDNTTAPSDQIIADDYGQEKYLSDKVPQHLLDKLNDDIELSIADKYEADQVSFNYVHYKNKKYSLEEMYDDNYLLDVYFGEGTHIGIYDDKIFLFNTLEELEDFGENVEEKINQLYPATKSALDPNNFVWAYELRFYEHANYSGAQYHTWKNMYDGLEKVGVVLPTSMWYKVSSSKIYMSNQSLDYVVDQSCTLIGYNTDYFSFKIVDGYAGLSHGNFHISNYANLMNYYSQNGHMILAGGTNSNGYAYGNTAHTNQTDKLIAFSVNTHVASDGVDETLTVANTLASFTPDLEGGLAFIQFLYESAVGQNSDDIVSIASNVKFKSVSDGRYLVQEGYDLAMRNENEMNTFYANAFYLIPSDLDADGFEGVGFHEFRAANSYTVAAGSTIFGTYVNATGNSSGNDNEKWMVMRHDKWYWGQPEYRIINAVSGEAIHWGNSSQVYMSHRNPLRDQYERFHMEY